MRESKLRQLIKLVEQSDIETLEVWSWGRRVKITKRQFTQDGQASPEPPQHLHVLAPTQTLINSPPVAPRVAVLTPEATPQPIEILPEVPIDKLVAIKSPMVGTFYRAPTPDAKPYVELGQMIEVGQVVCIIEAMKLMNEIESEVAGRVIKILAENTKPVEFGQALFLIQPV